MTDLERLYQQFRSRGQGHDGAVRALAEALALDEETIRRSLNRAARNPQHARPPRTKEAAR
jgi:hypothetical protein